MKFKIISTLAILLLIGIVQAEHKTAYFETCESCCGQFLIKKTLEENNIFHNDTYYFELFGGDVATYIFEIREKLEDNGLKTIKIGNGMKPYKVKRYLDNGYYIIGLKQRHWWLITNITNETYETYDLNLNIAYHKFTDLTTTDNLAVKVGR